MSIDKQSLWCRIVGVRKKAGRWGKGKQGDRQKETRSQERNERDMFPVPSTSSLHEGMPRSLDM